MKRQVRNAQQLESELNMVKKSHESAIEEIGRLESRIQSQKLDYQSSNELLDCEVFWWLQFKFRNIFELKNFEKGSKTRRANP